MGLETQGQEAMETSDQAPLAEAIHTLQGPWLPRHITRSSRSSNDTLSWTLLSCLSQDKNVPILQMWPLAQPHKRPSTLTESASLPSLALTLLRAGQPFLEPVL